jgi:hypothetical protein
VPDYLREHFIFTDQKVRSVPSAFQKGLPETPYVLWFCVMIYFIHHPILQTYAMSEVSMD